MSAVLRICSLIPVLAAFAMVFGPARVWGINSVWWALGLFLLALALLMVAGEVMRTLLATSNAIETLLHWVAEVTGWLMVVLMLVICFDIFVSRWAGFQVPGFGSTRLQEFEWYLHTVIFSGWLGYNYYLNAHPRVDSMTQPLPRKKKAWIELIGCLIFALPYTYICAYYGIDFVRQSYLTGEGSDAGPIGLPEKWIIKSFFVAGLFLLFTAVVGVTLRLIVFHFGGKVASEAKLPLDQHQEIL